jgi:hypothetical protein
MSFDELFKRDIPLNEAASFFIGLKTFPEPEGHEKTAGWQDPPDEEGLLEGQFAVPKEQALQAMGRLANLYIRLMTAYHVYSNTARGKSEHHLSGNAWNARSASEYLIKRMGVLGGPVHLEDIEAPPPSTNATEITKRMIRAEQELMAELRNFKGLVGESPMSGWVDSRLQEHQDCVDTLWKSLDPADAAPPPPLEGMPEDPAPALPEGVPPEGAPPEAAPAEEPPPEEPPAEAPPMEVTAAAMRMAKYAGRFSGSAIPKAALGGALLGGGVGAGLGAVGEPSEDSSRLAQALTGGAYGAVAGAGLGALGGGLRDLTQGVRLAKHAALAVDPYQAAVLKGKGEERGVTSLAAEARRDAGRRGQRAGKTLGMLGGGAGGAALAHKYLGGNPLATLGGAALGALAGRTAGSELGTEADIARNRSKTHILGSTDQQAIEDKLQAEGSTRRLMDPKGHVRGYATKTAALKSAAANMRFQKALYKLGQDPSQPQQPAEAPMASPTAGNMEAQNYLQAELAGRQAQEQNESQFYKQQLGTAQQMAQQAQQAAADANMQLEQVSQQAQQASAEIQAATQQAVAAQDEATRQTQEAARSRIGAQQMRAQMLQLASQDPEMFAAQSMPPTPPPGPGAPGAPGAGAEAPTEGPPPEAGGPAGEAPAPEQPPGGGPPAPPGPTGPGGPGGAPPGPGGGPPPEAGGAPPQPKMASVKTASVLSDRAIGAGIGAAAGAGGTLLAGSRAPSLREKVEELQPTLGGKSSFLQAARLAAAKKALAGAELAEENPVGAALAGGLAGGVSGAIGGPTTMAKARPVMRDLREVLGR